MFSVQHKAPGTRGPVGDGHHQGQQRKCPELTHGHPMVLTTVTTSSLLPGLAPGRGPPLGSPPRLPSEAESCLPPSQAFPKAFPARVRGPDGMGSSEP